LSFLVVTPAYLLSAVYLEPLIHLLTGMKTVPRETWWIGQALLLAIYSSQITNSCAKRVLMMCGEEKRLLRISVVEALANVALSVVLAYRMGVLGVALGTLIPTVLVGWFWVVPVTVGKLKLSMKSYFHYHQVGTVLPLTVFSFVLAGLAWGVPAAADSGFLDLGWRATVCMVPLVFLGRNVLRGISRSEG
jgi:O-antigen/teichoic acid export membrane protein